MSTDKYKRHSRAICYLWCVFWCQILSWKWCWCQQNDNYHVWPGGSLTKTYTCFVVFSQRQVSALIWSGTGCTTTSMSTSAREPPSQARSRSSSWWPGKPIYLPVPSVWPGTFILYSCTLIKNICMNRCPDSAKIKKKMLYSSSFDALKKSLVGVHKFIQVKCLHFGQDVWHKWRCLIQI